MPQTLASACTPRASVHDITKRDTVLSIDDLIKDRINPEEFFAENYLTEGMKTLTQQAFSRLEGKGDQGIFLLKQAMGGGKTHNLLMLGLLAKHPEYRAQFNAFYPFNSDTGIIKVIAFNGRETDHPLGIWGALAEQLGKREQFKDHYTPLRAPGETAWRNLFKGERVLVLIDELPPYLHAAHATQIGDSNLAEVTQTALTNLLSALNSDDCVGVCFILTDLEAAYGVDSDLIAGILRTLNQETNRSAMQIDPVRMTSDELYHILRKRLFEKLPNENEIREVGQAYAQAIRKANQMDITTEKPEEFATRVVEAYPFHPAMRDLYARFKENPGFQQTRGMIRLMRANVSKLWKSGRADSLYLIGAHHFDLSDEQVKNQIDTINNSFDNAIAHDFFNDNEDSIAQKIDHEAGNTDASDAAKLIFMASLSRATRGVIGLQINEIIVDLAEPGRDISRLKTEALERLSIEAWYLHKDQDEKYYFKNTENLVAKLNSLVTNYSSDEAKKELRARLKNLFQPSLADCYQIMLPLPALDEIQLVLDKVTLVILEPKTVGLDPAVHRFWEQTDHRNRVAFLTGAENTFSRLMQAGKRTKAIQHILDEFTSERRPSNDPQVLQANELKDKYAQNLHSAVRETFTSLFYPIKFMGEDQLENREFLMNFTNNNYDGEAQIKDILTQAGKFETDIDSNIFRQKVETRLFTQKTMQWSEIKRRAASNTQWQWHKPSGLESLKNRLISQDQWREDGNYLDKGPFEAPAPSVFLREIDRDAETGEVRLEVRKMNGDHVYYEFGAKASSGSLELTGNTLETDRLVVSFLCVDSERPTVESVPVEWRNKITIRHQFYNTGANQMCQLQALPKGQIKYTTDGSSPIANGGVYNQPFEVAKGSSMVLVVAEAEGIQSETVRLTPPRGSVSGETDQPKTIDADKPAVWKKTIERADTASVYQLLQDLEAVGAKLNVASLLVSSGNNFAELTMAVEIAQDPSTLLAALDGMRPLVENGTVSIRAAGVHFLFGRDLTAWAENRQFDIKPSEVEQ